MGNKNILQRRSFKFIIASLAIVFGLIVQLIIWWNTGYNNVNFKFYSLIIFIVNGLSSYYLFNLKLNSNKLSGLYAFSYVVVLFLILQSYSEFYIVPQIEKHGKVQKAIITDIYQKSSVNGDIERGVIYQYRVNNKIFTKSEFSENLQLGDSIKIKYFVSNPNFHKNYIN